MKKVLTVLICLLSILSVNVYAAKKKTTTKNTLPAVVEGKEPVKVYIFTKESCPFCEKAKTYINGLEETYGKYYDVVVYEIYDSNWKVVNKQYEKLMQKVAEKLGSQVSGVPYIVIGDGFDANEWNDATTGDNVKAAILKEYVNENYKDVVAPLLAEIEAEPDPHANDGIIIVVIGLALVAIVGSVVYFGRKNK